MKSKLTVSDTLFLANWERVLFVHFRIAPEKLQSVIPFELDLHEGQAYISLVAFTMSQFRPRIGNRFIEWLTQPFGSHSFFNIRTYVRHNDEVGIYFIREFVTRRMNIPLGRMLYGLPYHHGRLDYQHDPKSGFLAGTVSDPKGKNRFTYDARINPVKTMKPAGPETLDEFLIERYTAFNCWKDKPRLFRISHEPWLQTRADLNITGDSLLRLERDWFPHSRFVFANYSPGLKKVQMGRPHQCSL